MAAITRQSSGLAPKLFDANELSDDLFMQELAALDTRARVAAEKLTFKKGALSTDLKTMLPVADKMESKMRQLFNRDKLFARLALARVIILPCINWRAYRDAGKVLNVHLMVTDIRSDRRVIIAEVTTPLDGNKEVFLSMSHSVALEDAEYILFEAELLDGESRFNPRHERVTPAQVIMTAVVDTSGLAYNYAEEELPPVELALPQQDFGRALRMVKETMHSVPHVTDGFKRAIDSRLEHKELKQKTDNSRPTDGLTTPVVGDAGQPKISVRDATTGQVFNVVGVEKVRDVKRKIRGDHAGVTLRVNGEVVDQNQLARTDVTYDATYYN